MGIAVRVVAGAGAAGLGLVGAGYAGLAGQDNSTRDESGAVVEEGEVGAFRIRLGDCLSELIEGDFESVQAVPCAEPHASEVYAAFNMAGADGVAFPGSAAVEQAYAEGCLERFEPFVGRDFATSQYDVTAVTPTEGSWTEFDDREILCLVVNVDGSPLVGSAEGTGL
ncbi:septum formation family protein [Ilumatobacter sp.]|uniref:septum formation family protein n=1 Tax=Ilumatobacter sp. TaxID=1967498 RepID=UPI003AF73334